MEVRRNGKGGGNLLQESNCDYLTRTACKLSHRGPSSAFLTQLDTAKCSDVVGSHAAQRTAVQCRDPNNAGLWNKDMRRTRLLCDDPTNQKSQMPRSTHVGVPSEDFVQPP